MKINSPLGDIFVMLDGKTYPFDCTKMHTNERHSSSVDERYRIEVHFIPDGKEHTVSCCLSPSQSLVKESESGENFECMSYYSSDSRIKLSIGLESDPSYTYKNEKLVRQESNYDYDALFEEKNDLFYNSYTTLPFTKTNKYVFGVAWINNCSDELEE